MHKLRSIKGLGDIIELLTYYTGIKYLVKKIAGENCGCEQRKDYLNNKVPFNKIDSKDIPTMPSLGSSFKSGNEK